MADETPPNLLAAITAAVKDPSTVAPTAVVDTENVDANTETPPAADPMVGADPAGSDPATGDFPAGDPAGAAAADGTPAGDGSDASTTGDGDDDEGAGDAGGDEDEQTAPSDAEAAAEVAKTVKPAEPAKPVKEPDAVNDPIPAHLNPGTQKRMLKLIDTVKTVTQEKDKLQQDHQYVMQRIEQTKATPEQYGQTLQILAALNSGDAALREQAANALLAEAVAVFKFLGKPVPGIDPLNEHQDLLTEVRNGLLPAERAREIAIQRGRAQIDQERDRVQRTQAQIRQDVDNGIAKLNEWGAAKQTQDPHYAKKAAAVMAALKPVLSRMPPDQWVPTFEASYNAMPNPEPAVAAPVTPVAPVVPVNQPLRARTPAGNAAAEPKNLLEAITAGVKAVG